MIPDLSFPKLPNSFQILRIECKCLSSQASVSCHIFDTPLIIPSHMSSKNFSFLFGFLLISFIYICHDKESVFYQSSGISNRVTMDY